MAKKKKINTKKRYMSDIAILFLIVTNLIPRSGKKKLRSVFVLLFRWSVKFENLITNQLVSKNI